MSAAAPRDGGFTLLETLAALAITGLVLAAVSSIVAVTMAGLRSLDDRVLLTATARTLLDTIPQGAALRPGTTTGTSGPIGWRVDVKISGPAIEGGDPGGGAALPWRPAIIAISARSRTGRTIRLQTVGLVKPIASAALP